MKLLRLRLRNYRGIAEAELRFEPRGVTIVEGPNEVGKSSVGEAIGVLFEHLDSTKKTAVQEIKPVHRDEGAEIEADVETGPYAFTYSKRFHKKPETWLRVDRPRPENLTGREAHACAEAMLRETIDVALWTALRIEQGGALEGPKLAGQTRLSAALDAAAGTARAGDREESLLEAVRKEFDRSFTPTGQENKQLRDQQEALDRTRELRCASEDELRKLDADVRRSEQLRRALTQLVEDEKRLARAAEERKASLASLALLESDAETAEAKRSEAEVKARAAAASVADRKKFVDDAAGRREAHADLVATVELADPGLLRTAREFDEARAAETKAKGDSVRAAGLLELRRKDREFRHDELDLAQVEERASRVAKAKEEIVEAERVLAGPDVSDGVVAEIEAAVLELEKARAGLRIGSPQVTVTARAPIAPLVDGAAVALRSGEQFERTVEQSLTIDVPGVVEVKVSAGGSATQLRAAFEKAQELLAARLRSAQAPDLASARKARDACRDAARLVKERRKVVDENLRDLTAEQLRAKVESLRTRVAGYASQRAAEQSLPADLGEAKRLEADAEQEAKGRTGERDGATQRLETLRKRSTELAVAAAESKVRVQHAADATRDADEKLRLAREAESDAALDARRQQAAEHVGAQSRAFEEAKRRLAAAAPEEARALAENARKSAEGATLQLADARRELDTIGGRLQVAGEEGLAESLDVATAACARLEVELERTRARAVAAKLLHETLVAAKKEAQAAYVAPLQEQIEKLGRLVFGPTLHVELNPSLAIVQRTLDGITVPFESLSGGSKEQLSLLMRLACAIVVAKDGGAPLVIDDALGYTDAGRLESMGAALAQAGNHCQVIVLTCMPERYRHVGGARRVRLDPNGAPPRQ
ncbi:MAG: hypothetical protein EXS13_06055 [Planctomycetes bacterium]|nr:hypothetical protein [Planctomycetota bacterium]